MPSLKIQYITRRAQNWLDNTVSPAFLHIFDNSLNLKNSNGDVLSLVNPDIGPGPFNAVLEVPINFLQNYSRQSTVWIKHSNLYLNDWLIDTSQAEVWDPHPRWPKLSRSEIKRILPVLEDSLHSFPVRSALSTPAIPKVDSMSQLRDFSTKLAGLGQGLTPAGDDYLMGLMYALWTVFGSNSARAITVEIATAAGPRTTTLSRAWLQTASAGEAGISWHHFIQSIRKNPQRMRTHANTILHQGHSSGADAMHGFIEGLRNLV